MKIKSFLKSQIKRHFLSATQRRIVSFRGANFFADSGNKIEERLLKGDYDSQSMALLDMLVQPGHVCMDIGANIGVYTVMMALRSGRYGEVHSFEPVNHIRRRANLNIQLNGCRNVKINNFALGAEQANLNMLQVKEGIFRAGTSSIFETEAISAMGRNCFEEVTVTIRTLDSYITEKGIERLDFIKMDVEGFELSVLKGAERTLTDLRPAIFFEHDRKRLAKIGIDEAEFGRIFERAGYSVISPASVGGIITTRPYRFDGKGAKRDMLALPA